MADFAAVWVDLAVDQYLGLHEDVRPAVDRCLARIVDDPRRGTTYDPGTDLFTAPFDDGLGMVIFALSEQQGRVVVLRVLHVD